MRTPDLSPYHFAVAVPLDSSVSARADPVCSHVLVDPADPPAFPSSQSLAPSSSVNSQGPTHPNVPCAKLPRLKETLTHPPPRVPSPPAPPPHAHSMTPPVHRCQADTCMASVPQSPSLSSGRAPPVPVRPGTDVQLPPGQPTPGHKWPTGPSALVCILLSAC